MLLPTAMIALLAAQIVAPSASVLELQNRTIIAFRAPLGASAPEERVASATLRIREAMATGAVEVGTRPLGDGVLVTVGGRPAFMVSPAEADTAAGITVSLQADESARQLRQAIRELRESRSFTALGIGILLALAATALTSFAMAALVRARRRLLAWNARRTTGTATRLSIRGLTLVRADQIVRTGRFLITIVAWILGLAASYAYATFVLTRFPWTRPLGEALGGYLATTIRRLGAGALHAIPSLITVCLIFVVARLISRLVQAVFAAAAEQRIVLPGVHPDTASPTRRIVTAFVWLFALIVAYPYLPGSNSAAFRGVSVFAGLLITLGSTGLVGQGMSGLVLMYSRSFHVGDFVKIGQHAGTIVNFGTLSTKIRTTKNEFVTLPNSIILGGSITNYSFAGEGHHPLILYSSVTIGYDVPWRTVHDLLIAAAARTEQAATDPSPWVLQTALDDWYVAYQVNLAIDPGAAERMPAIYSALHANIQDAFNEAGIEIMSPSYHALRDGNTVAIPEGQRPQGRTGAFRVDGHPG